MKKWKHGRASSLLGIAAEIGFDNEKYSKTNYFEALEVVIMVELAALGLTEKEIERAVRFDLYPQDSRIEKLIEDFEPDDSSWATIRPLSFRAYEKRLELLAHIDELRNIGNDESAAKLTPEDWMNAGAEVAWYAYIADIDFIDDINRTAFAAIGGMGRRGKIFSPAKKAIARALETCCSSTKEVAAYFESQPVLDEIDVRVFFNSDDPDEPDTFLFQNLIDNKMSSPMKRRTLDSLISQVKRHRSTAVFTKARIR